VHSFQATQWSWCHFLLDALSTTTASSRGFAFEHLGTYLLGLAFKPSTRLSDIFEFAAHSDLANQSAELVAMYKTSNGKFSCDPVDLSSNVRPTYILGRTHTAEHETLAWLKDPGRTVFCFPAKTIGPDVIMIARLSNGQILPILVQFKNYIKATLSYAETSDALRTTDPEQFISHCSSEAYESASTSTKTTQSKGGRNKGRGTGQRKRTYVLKLFLIP
jgi:hypothetical protein